jgi:hypothetical protein
MRRWWTVAVMSMLGACQAPAARTESAAGGDALARLEATLAGDYDNDEQVRQSLAAKAVGVPHVREQWRMLEHGRAGSLWLWQLRTSDQTNAARASWLYRLSSDGRRVTATPYRPMDPATMETELADPKFAFRFVPERWAELKPCTLSGEWKSTQFSASADAAACSALLPGLGAGAALLPLRMTFEGDLLQAGTFADQARGAAATLDARRVHWFTGWSAINGGGPNFKAANQDWHTHDDVRVSSGSGRVPLRWRDGSASGYSLELERRTYAERKLSVLQLNVIEDASGRTLDYAWTSPTADIIGLNLGWLQVGLRLETP